MKAPSHLSPAAVAVWDQVVSGHTDTARLEALAPAFEAYCVQVARMRDAQARIDAEGIVVADEKGRPVPHPAIVLEKQAQAEVRAWGDRFQPPISSRRRRPGL